MTVWFSSRRRECPFRRSSSLASMAEDKIPIKVLITNTPPMVTMSMAIRNPQPASPPMVPASSVRIRLRQNASQKPNGDSPSGEILKTVTTTAMKPIITTDEIASHKINAPDPFEKVLSTAYLSRSLNFTSDFIITSKFFDKFS